MEPVSIVQKGEELYFTDLKRRLFEAAIRVLWHKQRRWSISEVRRELIGLVSSAYGSYAAAVAASGAPRAYTLPAAWNEALDSLIAEIGQLFFEQQEADEPNWAELEEEILRLARENNIEVLHLPTFPLDKVSAGMDVLEDGTLE